MINNDYWLVTILIALQYLIIKKSYNRFEIYGLYLKLSTGAHMSWSGVDTDIEYS